MPGFVPIKPPGNKSMLHAMLAEVWEFCWGGRFPFIDTPTVKWERSVKGYAAHAAAPGAAGKSAQPAAGMSWFEIQARGTGDYFLAKQVTAITQTQSGPNLFPTAKTLAPVAVQVAKQINMRRSVGKEIYDGGILTYSTLVGTDIDNNRQSADAQNNTQNEFAYPRYLTIAEVKAANIYANDIIPLDAQCYILAQSMPDGAGVFVNGGKVVWQEVSPPRVWDTP